MTSPCLPQARAMLTGVSRLAALLCLLASVISTPGLAAQYRSEVKEMPGYTPPTQQQAVPAEQRLKQVENNPYAKALTLQELAGEAAKNKDYKTAIQRLEQAIATDALSEVAEADMRRDLATLYVAGGQPAKAIAMLKQAVAGEGARDPELHYALAAAYVGTKQYREAVSPLEKAMSLTMAPKAAWYDLMFAIRHKLGQLDAAAAILQEKLARFGADKAAWMQLTAIHVQNKKYDKAAASMAVAYRQGYLNTQEELRQLAGLYVKGGAPYEAAALMQQWISAGKLDGSVADWEHLAGLWLAAKERKNALAAMAQAAQKSGKPNQYLEIAQLNMELENWPQAANAIQKAFQHGLSNKRAGEAYMALGMSQFQMGNNDAALGSFTLATKHSKTEKLARQWLDFIRAGVRPSKVAMHKSTADAGLVPEGEGYIGEAATAVSIASLPQARRGSSDAVGSGYETGDQFIPMGGIRAGSADGRIPPWTGGLHPGNTQGHARIDPYPEDKPLFVIDGSNMDKYKEMLSPGHQRLLKQYDSYKMPVFASRRSAAYPEAVYKATLENQKTARLIDPDVLEGARLGFPFRRPKTGNEVLWNHRTRYRGDAITMQAAQALVLPNGNMSLGRGIAEVFFVYGNLSNPGEIREGHMLLYYLYRVLEPPSVAGLTALAHETTDLTKGRQVWAAPPGIPRLFRLPANIGYDYPSGGSGGLQYIDQINMYNGGFDKYTWRLHGRKEMIVPYNAYRLYSDKLTYKQLLRPKHMDQTHTRYELHRVWVVEAETRPGESHKFSKRVFYVDEDAYGILMVDCYDEDGELWRFQEGHGIAHYNVPMTTTSPELVYDLRDQRYFASVLTNEEELVQFNLDKYRMRYFNPAQVKALLR